MSLIDLLTDEDLRVLVEQRDYEIVRLRRRMRMLEEQLAAANHTIQMKVLRIAELTGEAR